MEAEWRTVVEDMQEETDLTGKNKMYLISHRTMLNEVNREVLTKADRCFTYTKKTNIGRLVFVSTFNCRYLQLCSAAPLERLSAAFRDDCFKLIDCY